MSPRIPVRSEQIERSIAQAVATGRAAAPRFSGSTAEARELLAGVRQQLVNRDGTVRGGYLKLRTTGQGAELTANHTGRGAHDATALVRSAVLKAYADRLGPQGYRALTASLDRYLGETGGKLGTRSLVNLIDTLEAGPQALASLQEQPKTRQEEMREALNNMLMNVGPGPLATGRLEVKKLAQAMAGHNELPTLHHSMTSVPLGDSRSVLARLQRRIDDGLNLATTAPRRVLRLPLAAIRQQDEVRESEFVPTGRHGPRPAPAIRPLMAEIAELAGEDAADDEAPQPTRAERLAARTAADPQRGEPV